MTIPSSLFVWCYSLVLLKTAASFQQDSRSQRSWKSLRTHRIKVQLSETLNSNKAVVVIFPQQQIWLTVCNYERKSVSTNRDLKLMRRQMERRWFFFPPSIIKTCRNVDSLPTYNYQVILMCNGKLWLVVFFSEPYSPRLISLSEWLPFSYFPALNCILPLV